MIRGMDREVENNNIEIEMDENADIQIRDNLLYPEQSNSQREAYRPLTGRFICNVTCITVTMLFFTGIGVVLGLILSPIMRRHGII